MKLMLVVMFACITFGLVTRRCGAREQLTILGLATAITALYYFYGERLM